MLTLTDLSYRIGGRVLFKKASAEIERGKRIGLVGQNGSGKTTLLRLILGDIEPDNGKIRLARGTAIGTVSQGVPSGELTPLEIVLSADRERQNLVSEVETTKDPIRISEIQDRLIDIGAHSAPSRAAAILAGLGIRHSVQNELSSTLSGGWRMRIALAATLFIEPDLLLLDEPTNHLDLEASMWLENYLKNYSKTLIVVSHDRHILNTVPDNILHLEAQQLKLYSGGYDNFAQTHTEYHAARIASNLRQDRKRKKLESFINRFRYNASKARQAQSRLKALEKLENSNYHWDHNDTQIIFPETEVLAPPLITCSGVSVGYIPGKPVLSDINIRLDPEDRIALLGANGNGKSTFAKLLSGDLTAMTGEVGRSKRLRVGYFSQHQIDELESDMTPVELLSRQMGSETLNAIRSKLGGFGFQQEKADITTKNLSGGEKARLNLALISCQKPQILVLDEPTNHLDLETRTSLIEALNHFRGAVILITHDWELLALTTEQLWLVSEGRIRSYSGDLNDYRQHILATKKEGQGQKKKNTKSSKTKQMVRRDGVKKRAEEEHLRRAVERAEQRLNKALITKVNIEAMMADQYSLKQESEELSDLNKQLKSAEQKIIEEESLWLKASEKLDLVKYR